jgi:uncharacterized protein YjbJ (UPF0337 family)
MYWDRIEDNWKRIKGNVNEQWDGLTEGQLASRVQETYGISDDEPEPELTDWQQRLNEINRARSGGPTGSQGPIGSAN